jgi:cell division protein FtsQ
MAGEFIYTDDLPFKPAASRKIEKGLKRLLIIAGIILAAELLWLFGVSPCIPLSTVEVSGFTGFDGAEVLSWAGIGEGASWISVDVKEAERLLAAHHMVESARVVKRFPDRLSIFLEGRQAVALSLAQVRDRLLPVYFDKHGVVFRIGDGPGEAPGVHLPVVSGLVFENPVLGMRLPAAFGSLLSEFAQIAEEAPELLEAVSEIRINRRPFNGFDILLYPVHYPIRVRLGENFNEETLRYALLMLDVLKAGDTVPAEIDFRSGIGAYTVKEAPSGE